MITIDIVDDNNERSSRPVSPTMPVVRNVRSGSFDAAYESARSYHQSLLGAAQEELRASGVKASGIRGVASTLEHIARALTAWL